MAPGKKKRQTQTRLTFEPVASPSSSTPALSPAKVRYSAGHTSSPSRTSPSKSRSRRATKPSHTRLQTPLRTPTASFMPRIHGSRSSHPGTVSSDDSASEVDDASGEEEATPDLPAMRETSISAVPDTQDTTPSAGGRSAKQPRSSQSVSTRLKRTVIDDDDEDAGDDDGDDDGDGPSPSSSLKRRSPAVISIDESEDDGDHVHVVSRLSNKRSRPAIVELDDSDGDVISPAKKRKMPQLSSLKKPHRLTSSPTKPHKAHRSEKQKKIELLRRRRAGEKIDRLTSSESSSADEARRGMYDTDSDEQFEVLKDFDDEEQDEAPQTPHSKPQSKGKNGKRSRAIQGHEDAARSDDDLEDFVTDDDDAPIGAPAHLDIPLEFTAQAHKPLKDQFPFVIEWLVHNRINPAFERKDPVYSNAWRKLDDEFRGLATSKFASAAWKADFYRSLKGRPKMEAYEMDKGGLGDLYETCEACGRRGHPATWKIVFQGHPYYKDTLVEVENDSSSSDEMGSDNDMDARGSDHESVDTQDMPLVPTTKAWYVGAVCCSNAETAHSLLHWKHALMEWVEDKLDEDGWMSAQRLKEREKMKAKKRRALANKIVDGWQTDGIITSLYADFKSTLEQARNKATTGRGRGRFRY
ncbi:hypothetical protein F4778DRAFT_584907 [Xylariomycetidae sp. FL2044]|nr:hypothetical protein F4778DRAFT_584907 [Xylariomycetidae sp. FL2044]